MPENYPHHLRGLRQPWDPQAPRNAFERVTDEYDATRPDYPAETVTAALGRVDGTGLVVADIGAGTGKLTAPLYRRGAEVIAVEPALAMRQQCEATMRSSETLGEVNGRSQWSIMEGTAESTGLADGSVHVVTYAQCWHWVDADEAIREAARILRPSGRLAIVANQMDVTVSWVHRLTRIMRSGDVLRPEHTPQLGSDFTVPKLHRSDFMVKMRPCEIMALARTRSSYLKSNLRNRQKMQENLRWYLHDCLKFDDEDVVSLPYYALTWTAQLKARVTPAGGKMGR